MAFLYKSRKLMNFGAKVHKKIHIAKFFLTFFNFFLHFFNRWLEDGSKMARRALIFQKPREASKMFGACEA